jgi:uncharacterized damage-inducible protein DinB
LRKELKELLTGGQAHAGVKSILESITPQARNTRLPGMSHTIWELLEHMRIAQEDILRYTLDSTWVSPSFPDGYWPDQSKPMTESDWDSTLDKFQADLNEVIQLLEDLTIDLTTEIPHGEGHTYLREILLVADHNSYHLGQIVQIRKAIGDWPE